MKRLSVFFIIAISSFIGIFIWWQNGLRAINPNDKTEHIFVIKKGEGLRDISYKLKKKDLIKDPVVFFLLIKKLGIDGKIQAGDFRLSPSMNASEIAQNLTHGTLDIWVTIPEGKRAEEIANILQKEIPSYKNLWQEKLVSEEGYLFPDTYLIPKDADIDLIISMMKNNFEKKYSQIENLNKTSLSKKEIVIIGSLVEREARLQNDRPLVASVILNRLRIGMPLQIDATIQYMLGYQKDKKTWWKKDLAKQDLSIDSYFNSYKNPGLPPTPISNPGFNVLNAVVNAPDTNYLYYLSDKNGFNHYAKTIDEHNDNIKKYGL